MAAPVSSVVHAFAIIRALANGRELTLSEVSSECGISPSSCLGLLRTLVGEGVLHLLSGKRYALQPRWAAVADAGPDPIDRLQARARLPLERAARLWNAPIGLWRVVGRDRLQLTVLGQSPAATRIHMEEGLRQPIGSGAIGRALAAAEDASPDELRRRFAGVRWHATMTAQDYVAQVAQAKLAGHAIDDELTYAGITSVAVCVRDLALTLCLSASMFAGSRTPDELTAIADSLRALGAELSRTPAKSRPASTRKTP